LRRKKKERGAYVVGGGGGGGGGGGSYLLPLSIKSCGPLPPVGCRALRKKESLEEGSASEKERVISNILVLSKGAGHPPIEG